MELKNKVEMSISDFSSYRNDENVEFAYGKVDFLSTEPNSRRHVYSEETIRKYASSIVGKWLTAEYDRFEGDVTSHTNEQVIVGMFPEQEIEFRINERGYFVATAKVIISKLYATDFYEMFKQNNFRNVSIEALVGFTDETMDYDDGAQDKVVEGFNICACTVLGLSYMPSVPNANIVITQMSQEKTIEGLKTYEQIEEEALQEKILSKLCDIENELKAQKGESMEELNKEELLENQEVQAEIVENSEENAEEVIENAEEAVEEEKEEAVENVEEDNDKEEDSNEEEVEDYCKKYEDLLVSFNELSKKAEGYESEISKFREFKAKMQEVEKAEVIESTMAKVKSYASEELVSQLEASVKECAFEDISAWRNAAMASISDLLVEKLAKQEEGILDMGIPRNTKKVNSLFD